MAFRKFFLLDTEGNPKRARKRHLARFSRSAGFGSSCLAINYNKMNYYMYVIFQLGGPYSENCDLGLENAA